MSHKVSNNVAYCMLNVWSHAKISIATQILRLFCFTRSAELGFLTRTEDCHKPWTVSAGCSTTLAEYVCYLMGAGGWGGGWIVWFSFAEMSMPAGREAAGNHCDPHPWRNRDVL